MAQYSPPGVTDVANLALLEIGSQPISDIDDTNGESPAACRAAFWQAVGEVGRAHNWNCLKLRKNLTQLVLPTNSSTYGCGTSIGWPGCQPSTPPPYWLANTVYTGGTLVTYGEAIYYCLQGYTSGTNFIVDMTAGFWAQIYSSFYAGLQGASNGLYEWKYGYALPGDFLLLNELNGTDCRQSREVGDLYELFVSQKDNGDETVSNSRALFCNQPYADVKYTALIQDPTVWDPHFINCVAVLLGSKISTQIRGDDGKMAIQLKAKYEGSTLPWAMLKDSGERKLPRYDPTRESNFLRSRWGSTAG